ncbi:MAG: sugar transferase [Actinomycetota bacterium]
MAAFPDRSDGGPVPRAPGRADTATRAAPVPPAPLSIARASDEEFDVRRDEHDPDELTGSEMRRRVILADTLALSIGALVALLIQHALRPMSDGATADQSLLLLASIPAFVIGAGWSELHRSRANEQVMDETRNVVKTVLIGITGMLLIAVATRYKDVSRAWVILTAVSMIGCALVERRIVRSVFGRLRSEGRHLRRILIVGTDEHARALFERYSTDSSLGYHPLGLIDTDDTADRSDPLVIGDRRDLEHALRRTRSCGVVISLRSIDVGEVNSLTRRLTDDGYHVALTSGLRDIDVNRLRPQWQDGHTLIYVEPVIREGWRASAKRALDLTLASTVLLATMPIMIASIVAIKVTSPGPAFFRQTRVGRHGERFELVKLRSMVVDAEARKADLAEQNEADGPLFKMQHDPRITRVGRFIRSTSIDELPQLFNVLRGEMSMVGPRPALPDEVEQWDPAVRERLRVLPGLTGMWQVSGRSDSSFEQYKRLDLYYVDNWSLKHDLRICLRTVGVVLTGRGAS